MPELETYFPRSQPPPPSTHTTHTPAHRSVGRWCIDLALVQLALVVGTGGLPALVQLQHLLDQRDHAVVAGFVGGVSEVNGADGELFDVLLVRCEITAVESG